MTNGLPWSVRGIDPDLREQAVEAAHRSGLSVGQWLNTVLKDNLVAEDAVDVPAPVPAMRTARAGRVAPEPATLDAVGAQLHRLASRRGATALSRVSRLREDARDSYDPSVIDEALAALEAQNRALEKRTGDALGAIAAWIESAESRPAVAPIAYPAAPAGIAPGPVPHTVAPALDAIATRLAEIEKRLEGERSAPANAPAGARATLERLGAQLDALQRPLPKSAPADAEPNAPPTIGDIMAGLENRLSTLIRESQTGPVSGATGPSPAIPTPPTAGSLDLARLEARLDARFEDIVRQLALRSVPSVPGDTFAMASPPASTRMAGATARPDFEAEFAAAMAEVEQRRHMLGAVGPARAERSQAHAAFANTPADRPTEDRSDAMAREIGARLDALIGRIDAMRASPPAETGTALQAELHQLSAALERLSPQNLVASMESALARIGERIGASRVEGVRESILVPIERLAGDLRHAIDDLRDSRSNLRTEAALAAIAERLDALGRDVPGATDLAGLRRETGEMKELVRKLSNEPLLDALNTQFDRLDRRLAAVIERPGDARAGLGIGEDVARLRAQIEALAPETFAARLEASLGALAAAEQRIAELVQKFETTAAKPAPKAQFDRLFDRLDQMQAALQPGGTPPAAPELGGIEAALRQLDARLDDISPARERAEFDALQAELSRIGARLDREDRSGDGHVQSAIEAALAQVQDRFERARPADAGTQDLEALHAGIARLAERLDNTVPGDRSASLERAIADLAGRLEGVKDAAFKAAESAARSAASQAAREALANAPREGDPLTAEGLLLIKRDLAAFKAAQGEADRDTRAALETVHGLLQTMLGRLGSLEGEIGAAAPAISPARAAPKITPAAAAPTIQAPAPATLTPTSALSKPPPAPANPEATELDVPIEPGAARQRFERLGAAPPAPAVDARDDRRTQFIAAARRAVQAASEQSAEALASEALAPAAKTGPGAVARLRGAIAQRRKPILLGLAALIFAAGAVQLTSTLMKNRATVPQGDPAKTGQAPGASADPSSTASPTEGSAFTPLPAPPPAPTQPSSAAPVPAAPENTLPDKSAQRLGSVDSLTTGSIAPSARESAAKADFSGLVTTLSLPIPDALRQSALAGEPIALTDIGTRLLEGRGGPKSPAESLKWFEAAAAQGHGPAEYRLGTFYREGKTAPADAARALHWFQKAADHGHALAMHNAAVLLAEGVNGAPDYSAAATWFRKGAERGIKDSQFNIAILLARGLGAPQDLVEAYKWFSVAADQGDADASKKRDDIGGRLTSEQLAEAKRRIAAYSATSSSAGPTPNAQGATVFDQVPPVAPKARSSQDKAKRV